MNLLFKFWIVAIVAVTMLGCSSENNTSPHSLKCEYIENPIGIDNPQPRFSWIVGNNNRGNMQEAYQVLVGTSPDALKKNTGDVWDSEKVTSGNSFHVVYGGPELKSGTKYFWKVRMWDQNGNVSTYSKTAKFETGLFNPEDWKAKWIGDGRRPPEKDEDFYDNIPVPIFRKTFEIKSQLTDARLYISGLGYYEAFLNGEKIGNHVLDPGWTNYGKTTFYTVYDLTDQVHEGKNVMGVMLGNGWYNPLPLRLFGRLNLREILSIGQPKVIAQLRLTYQNGNEEWITTNESWKTSTGPIMKNNIYLGETYDARNEKPGWNTANYDDSAWNAATQVQGPEGDLKYQFIPPIKHTRTLKPIAITEPSDGVFVIDMGQNFAGVIRMKVSGDAGTEVKLRYAELLLEDGNIDVRTSVACQIKEEFSMDGGPGAPATAWQEDNYILKGEGEEIFQPAFTFHGFRYVEVTGYPGRPALENFEGIRLNADLEDVSEFECSNELFNTIQDITEWTFLSNVFSIESDCPAREKFGYGGDMVGAGPAFMMNYDMANFYEKTVRDFQRDQRDNGGMSECAPDIGINARGVTENTGPPGWTLAHPFLLDKLYQYYGNEQLIKEQYIPLKRLVDFYNERVTDHIIRDGISDHNMIGERPRAVTSTSFYYEHVLILAKMAKILNKPDDHEKYSRLAEDIKMAFINEFVDEETGTVGNRSQTAQTCALYYDLVPDDNARQKVVDALIDEIEKVHRSHLSTGIFCTRMMLLHLGDLGRADLAYTIANQRDYPGYGFMIDNGATTLWENWEKKIHDSKNHPMFGSVSEWFYSSVLGIRPAEDAIAFDKIIIKPEVTNQLEWAKGSYQSVRGKIVSSWKNENGKFIFDVEIPANAVATVHIPVSGPSASITEGNTVLINNGELSATPTGLTYKETKENFVIFEAGGGSYHFEVD